MEPSSPLQNPNVGDALASSISTLRSLLATASSCLSAFPPSSSSSSKTLIPCPHNSHHLVPPESLLRHALLCRFGTEVADGLSEQGFGASVTRQSLLFCPQPDPDSSLCFTLDAATGVPNLFYDGCPGVVSVTNSELPDSFSVPGFLAMECSGLVDSNKEFVTGNGILILPSEFWKMKCELAAWSHPLSSRYSYSVLLAAATVGFREGKGAKEWILCNSHRFGILIDVTTRDHIFLLLRLCLRAIAREACATLTVLWAKDDFGNSRESHYDCPRLARSTLWLAEQLAVLYGANGTLFAVGMVKEAIVESGLRAIVDAPKSEAVGEEQVVGSQVFVSEVAAAVAALHNRASLEEKIKALQLGLPVSKHKLISEYSYTLARGSEERARRPNYRHVLEHNGLLSQNMQSQESGKVKTREEMLAEERDYKRRRMSYRGKRAKRNPTEVLRDIIEEQMEEIWRMEGTGHKVLDDRGVSCSEVYNENARDPHAIFPDSKSARTKTYGCHEDDDIDKHGNGERYESGNSVLTCESSFSHFDKKKGLRKEYSRRHESQYLTDGSNDHSLRYKDPRAHFSTSRSSKREEHIYLRSSKEKLRSHERYRFDDRYDPTSQ